MSETVAHLSAWTISVETVGTGIVIAEASHSSGVLVDKGLGNDTAGLIGQLALTQEDPQESNNVVTSRK